MNRILFLLTVLLAVAPAQDILLQENFNSSWSTVNPPAGWRIHFTGEPSTNDWYRADPNSAPWLDNPTAYALIDSTRPEQGLDSLVSPSIDCSQYNQVTLRCSTFFCGRLSIYTAKLMGAAGGGGFTQVIYNYFGQTIGPTLQTFELPWASGQPNVRFAWVLTGQSGAIPYWAVDNVTVTGASTTVEDVACTAILSPPATVDSGAPVIPAATVRNLSGAPASFPVIMNIGGGYSDTVQVTGLPPNDTRDVSFASWRPDGRGLVNVVCNTEFVGDVNPANDTQYAQTRVRVIDVSAMAMIAPPDTVDSGAVVQPVVALRNVGTDSTPPFQARISIGNWHDNTTIGALGPGDQDYASFGNWLASDTGTFAARCTLVLASDMQPANNVVGRNVIVASAQGWDAAAVSIGSPVSPVGESVSVSPDGVIANFSSQSATILARFRILSGTLLVYEDSADITLDPGATETVTFRPWVAWPPGDNYRARLRVYVGRDINPSNDSVVVPFVVRNPRHDVGVQAILQPAETVFAGAVTPRAVIRNYGDFAESFFVQMAVNSGMMRIYTGTAIAAFIQPGDSTIVEFATWTAPPGNFQVKCSTMLVDDVVPGNNSRGHSCRVITLYVPYGWNERRAMPSSPSGKDVKGGGALALFEPLYRVYALKGNKTADFHRYDILSDTWTPVTGVPAGEENKAVKDGGALTTDGNRYVYVTKGNNTLSFYRYDVLGDSWRVLEPVPTGVSGKKVKGGTSMAYIERDGAGYVYLLKGYKNEFYRYNTQTGLWQTLDPAPATVNIKYNKGSFIAYDGAGLIYAHQVKYNQLFAFNLATGTWQTSPQLLGMPLASRITGKSKKSKDGAAGSWADGSLYAFKGGGTQEFWRYNAAGDSWSEFDTIPAWGSTSKKKAVKGGGSLTALGGGIFFALKGNKTREFWSYRTASTSPVAERPVVTPARAGASRLIVARPNPAHDHFTVELGPGIVTPALLRLYDTRGALMLEQRTADRTAIIDCRDLPRGIYFIGTAGRPGERAAVVLH